MYHDVHQGSEFHTVPASTKGIFRTGTQTNTEIVVIHTTSDTELYRSVLAISGHSGHFGRKRYFGLVQNRE